MRNRDGKSSCRASRTQVDRRQSHSYTRSHSPHSLTHAHTVSGCKVSASLIGRSACVCLRRSVALWLCRRRCLCLFSSCSAVFTVNVLRVTEFICFLLFTHSVAAVTSFHFFFLSLSLSITRFCCFLFLLSPALRIFDISLCTLRVFLFVLSASSCLSNHHVVNLGGIRFSAASLFHILFLLAIASCVRCLFHLCCTVADKSLRTNGLNTLLTIQTTEE